MRTFTRLSIRVCSVLLGVATTCAHSVWIEPSHDQLVIRFAEPGMRFEKSPGHLDSLSAPLAFILVTNAPAAAEASKKSDHFLLSEAAPTNVVCAESAFTVRGGRKPIFYARWQPAGAGSMQPLLTLDLVPTGKTGEVRAFFRGEPLANIKAVLRTPQEEEHELTADSEGFLRFEAEAPGQYLLTIAHHREPLAGFHLGRPYQQTSHNCSLVWLQSQ
jgi:hypothetical protein